ncbi:MAG: alpha-amylase family glycosyl hydrolase [Bacteriovoracia bacterium]
MSWWKETVIYQIYPLSYKDADGDGKGDLAGIRSQLDYLEQLGIETIWLSPIFPSPMHDFGYDVADYCNINQIFGNMNEFDLLLEDIHARGMKLILEFVPNHTASEHKWFKESKKSKDNPYRNWYIWADPKEDGTPPNNWISFFGGPAWTKDEASGQYYLHQFHKHQPELNFRHPPVWDEMEKIMKFWFDKGVDGFRIDVIWLLMKDKHLRDEPVNPDWCEGHDPHGRLQHIYTQDLTETHEIVKKMRKVADEYEDRLLIGEIYLPVEKMVQYYGKNLDECHMPYNFNLILMDWDPGQIKTFIDHYLNLLPKGATPNWVLGNHDKPRVASRIGTAQAKVAAILLFTLPGVPTIYYGEEIGMENVHIPPNMCKDPPAVQRPELADLVGRDPFRTPMQWNDKTNAGFCSSSQEPWLPIADNYKEVNVEKQVDEFGTFYSIYKKLIALKHSDPRLLYGDFKWIEINNPDLMVFERRFKQKRMLVVCNFSDKEHKLDLSSIKMQGMIIMSVNLERRQGIEKLDNLTITPNEAMIINL